MYVVLFCAWIISARSLGLGSISISRKPRERGQRCHNGGCSGREKCDERTQSCQCGNQGGGWLGRNATNKATETTVRGEIGANEAMESPIRRGSGANEAMRSPGAGRRERSHLGHDCAEGRFAPECRMIRREARVNACDRGRGSPDKKTPGWTVALLEERDPSGAGLPSVRRSRSRPALFYSLCALW
jgi:hypothetical protein